MLFSFEPLNPRTRTRCSKSFSTLPPTSWKTSERMAAQLYFWLDTRPEIFLRFCWGKACLGCLPASTQWRLGKEGFSSHTLMAFSVCMSLCRFPFLFLISLFLFLCLCSFCASASSRLFVPRPPCREPNLMQARQKTLAKEAQAEVESLAQAWVWIEHADGNSCFMGFMLQ